MPTASRPNFTLSNGTVLVGDVGKSGGELDILCCARSIAFNVTADSEEIICDPLVGVVDRIDFNPRATLTIEELNVDETTLKRAFDLIASSNTYGYRIVGKGSNPATTPTSLSEVDGPHAPVYAADDADILLNNTLIMAGNITAWTRNNLGVFSLVATFTADYANAATNLATGELHIQDTGHNTPLYFTYKYQPMSIGAIELKNPWATLKTDVFLRIYHEHGDGVTLVVIDIWRARPKIGTTLQLKNATGARVVPLQLVFDVFADSRYHSDSDLFTITLDTIGRVITPETDYGCDGAAYATPVA
jgi:hypothetical protein